MDVAPDIWKALAGIAIFVLGMSFIEETMRSLAGRKFKLFLKKQTSNKVKAIGAGTIVTGLLQSSSVVNLLVLSLAGSGVIQMKNALALMLGSNLGSTLYNWIVATLGFEFNINNLALPIAGITGISLSFLKNTSRWYQWSKFLFGFSFLFVGLSFIKEGMQEIAKQTDLSQFNQYPAIVFVLIGIVLTSIVQSSSATVAIVLSALYSNAIPLYTATAIVLGSEIGTTLKLFLASAKGVAVKKRVALGNFLYNVILVIVILLLLRPVNWLITDIIQIHDNLIALVFFQTLINVAGIILFYPFLNVLGRFLEKRFAGGEKENLYISTVPATDTDIALEAIEKDSYQFIFHILSFTSDAFDAGYKAPEKILHKNFEQKPLMEKYDYIKIMHGEIHGYCIQLQNAVSSKAEAARLEQLVSCIRNCMYTAKSIRDVIHDIKQLRDSSNDIKYNFYLNTRDKIKNFCKEVSELIQQENTKTYLDNVKGIYRSFQEGYSRSLEELYEEGIAKHVNQMEISTLINFNRVIYTAYKSMAFALKDYLLNAEEADSFDNLPGFIR
jgi:phosphate:Na+ symporter